MPKSHKEPSSVLCIKCVKERRARKQALEPIDLDDDVIAALIEIAGALSEMRAGSIAEGYVFKDGKIIPPQKKASRLRTDS